MKQMHKIYRYTLIEILVAVAVLLVMMGFLFRFVISAQNLWTASNSRMNQYEQMQTVFDLLNEDFNRALFGKNDLYKNADGKYDYYFYMLGRSISNSAMSGAVVVFFTNDEDKSSSDCGKLKAVVYWYCEKLDGSEVNHLYRFEGILEKDGNDYYFIREKDFDDINSGLNSATCNFTAMQTLIKAFTGYTVDKDDLEDYVVAEEITKFEISAIDKDDNTIGAGLTSPPEFIRVNLEVGVPDALKGERSHEEVLNRSFSRIFFIDSTK